MNEKDLDSATRELNQLNGTAKVLLSDWLEAARRRLEVLQALQVRFALFLSLEPWLIIYIGRAISGNPCFFASRLALYTE